MRSRRSFLSVQISGLLLAGSVALAAGPARRGPVGMPSDYVPRLDGAMATADLGGQTWGVWAYRAAGEFDIAVSTRGPSGVWSAPIFLGQRDGLDQVDPVVAIDARGSVYVAYATAAQPRILLSVLPAGASAWSAPQLISAGELASTPGVRVVGDRLVIAFRVGRALRVVDVALVAAANDATGIEDGPDGIGSLGNTGTSELPGPGDSGGVPPPPPPDDGSDSSSN